MPRLVQINTTAGRGSTGKIARRIATLAGQAGWECFVAHGARYAGPPDSGAFQVSGRAGELGHFLGSCLLDRHGLGSACATKRLIAHLKEVAPDVVQIHNLHGYYAHYELLLRFLAAEGIPTVITLHDFWLMTGHCAYINSSCARWETGCGNCPRLKEYPAALVDRSGKNWALKRELVEAFDPEKLVIVPVSHWLEAFAKRSLLGDRRICTIQNGVDTQLFRPCEGEHSALWKQIDWRKYTLLTVADRWTEANGFQDIVALSHLLPEDMQIVMVGLTGRQLQGLPDKIVGVGHTDNVQQLIELYSSADVLLNASREVTFGLVTAEAMACGTPAIVLRHTAGEEIIDAETGFAIDAVREIPPLVRACREKAGAFKQACRRRIVENFDAEKQYAKYVALYNRLIGA